MANFITDDIIKETKEMISEVLDSEQDGIDDLFGDQEDQKNQRVTLNLRVNFSAKSDTAIEIKTPYNYILEPSIPAKKQNKTLKRIVDIKQGRIAFTEKGGEDEKEEEDTEE
jgi:hypothetical protein